MVNYTFVWPSAQENAPDVAENMGWAPYPRVVPDEPAHVTLGGINLGVSTESRHPDLALDAAACLRSAPNQIVATEKGGLPPTTEALYDDPRVQEAFPFADVLRETLTQGSARPQSPAYNDISLAIQRNLHPPRDDRPGQGREALRSSIQKALKSGGPAVTTTAPPATKPVEPAAAAGRRGTRVRGRPAAACDRHAVAAASGPAPSGAWAGCCCAPAVIVMLLVTAYPIVYAIVLSLQRYDLRFPDQAEFVGLRNYVDVLASSLWWQDLATTLVITVVSVVIELVLGMGLACSCTGPSSAGARCGPPILVPYGIITVVAALAWRFAFDPTTGFVNGLLNTDRAGSPSGGVAVRHHPHRGVEDDAVHGPAPAGRPHPRAPRTSSGRPGSTGPPPWQRFTQITLPADEAGDPRRPAVPHPRRLPDLRLGLRADPGRPRHRDACRSSATTAVQPAQPGDRLGGVGADLRVRDHHRLRCS